MTKSARMKWEGHAAYIEMRTRFWSGNRKAVEHLGDLGLDGRIILKHILRK
jgi:hypothetical protein